jgi:hypothetical protein
MTRGWLAVPVLLLAAAVSPAADPVKKTVWQGVIHLGDNPEQYPKVTSAGMTFQVPLKLDAAKKARLTVTATDVQTQAGDGHYVEVIAHFESKGFRTPAKEVVVDTFRIKDEVAADTDFTFDLDPTKNLDRAKPTYYSVRIKVDTGIPFGLWDDFLVKRIAVEQ